MGLDISHDVFSGSYSSFNRFRQLIAKAIGGSFPPHEDKNHDDNFWYYDKDIYNFENHPGLLELLKHSDCDGEISPELCQSLANDLEDLLPQITELDNGGGGHIARAGGYVAVAKKFIDGCNLAYSKKEPLEFW